MDQKNFPTLYKVLAMDLDQLAKSLTKEEVDFLSEVRNRLGPREFDVKLMRKFQNLGVVAGDYSRAYLTDKGDTLMEKLGFYPRWKD